MQLKKMSFLFIVILLTGCSYTVPLRYTGNLEIRKDVTPSIGKIIIVDKRGLESNLLGIVRGGFGNKIITMRTDKPINKVVEDVYRQALTEGGFFNDNGNNLLIFKGNINSLYSTYGMSFSFFGDYEASVVIDVSLVDSQTGKTIFQSPYRSEVEEWDWGRGFTIFISEDVLRDIAEEALNYTVDKTITDPEFIKALDYRRVETTETGDEPKDDSIKAPSQDDTL